MAEVLIPNGMEFYVMFFLHLFSFFLVSIPNGMEFYVDIFLYFFNLFSFQFPTGWNSTLQNSITKFVEEVSIPNGMEFSTAAVQMRLKNAQSFNSQRDGILPLIASCWNFYRSVSIPNGMEFYRQNADRKRLFRYVSIPNGMEFYKNLREFKQ